VVHQEQILEAKFAERPPRFAAPATMSLWPSLGLANADKTFSTTHHTVAEEPYPQHRGSEKPPLLQTLEPHNSNEHKILLQMLEHHREVDCMGPEHRTTRTRRNFCSHFSRDHSRSGGPCQRCD
jgi:hypothetical protein